MSRDMTSLVGLFAVFVVVQQSLSVDADCGPDECRGLLCTYGRAYDSDGCVICDCYYPCEDVQCSSSQQCQPVRVSGCDGIRCPQYTGVCTDVTTKAPCPAVSCVPGSCTFGFIWDSASGCQTCQCYHPCQYLDCPLGQVCKLTAPCQRGEECRDGELPYCDLAEQSSSTKQSTSPTTSYIPSTISSTTLLISTNTLPSATSTRSSTSRSSRTPSEMPSTTTMAPCPAVSCDESIICSLGYHWDSQGCQTCQCHESDLCEYMDCPVGMICKLTPFDCLPSTECRDGPMLYCAVDDRSSTTESSTAQSTSPTTKSTTYLTTTSVRTSTSTTASPSTTSLSSSTMRTTSSSKPVSSSALPAPSTISSSTTTSLSTSTTTTTTRLPTKSTVSSTSSSTPPSTPLTVSSSTTAGTSSSSSPSSTTSTIQSSVTSSSISPPAVASSTSSTVNMTEPSGVHSTTMMPEMAESTTLSTLSTSTSSSSSSSSSSQVIRSVNGVIRINASFEMAANDIRHYFMQQLQQQIGSYLNIRSESVKITDLKAGSIIVYFVIVVPGNISFDSFQQLMLNWLHDDVYMTLNNQQYPSRLVQIDYSHQYSPVSSTSPSSIDVTTTTPDSYNFLLLVILVCVLVPLGIAAVIFVSVCIWRRKRHVRSQNWTTITNQTSHDSSAVGSKVDFASSTSDCSSGHYVYRQTSSPYNNSETFA